MGLASAQQAYLRTRRNPADGQINPMDVTVPFLPEGWKEELDGATGVHFYVHEESGKRSWVMPNFRPPGPGVGPPPPPVMGGGPPVMGGTSFLELLIFFAGSGDAHAEPFYSFCNTIYFRSSA